MRDVVITAMGRIAPPPDAVSPDRVAAAMVGGSHVASAWFDPQPYLGERGYKYYPQAGRMLLAAATVLLRAPGVPDLAAFGERGGAVVGTSFGNLDVLAAFGATIRARGAEALQPMEAPSFSVNVSPSLLSLRYALRAFNITVTQAVTAGLDAIRDAAHHVANGRAAVALAGAVEPTIPAADAARDTAVARQTGAILYLLQRRSDVDPRAPAAALVGGFSRRCVAGDAADLEALDTRIARMAGALAPGEEVEVARVVAGAPMARAAMQVASERLRRGIPGLRWREETSCADAVSTIAPLAALADFATPGVKGVLCANRFGHVSGLFVRVARPWGAAA